jgi:hypothetical protein
VVHCGSRKKMLASLVSTFVSLPPFLLLLLLYSPIPFTKTWAPSSTTNLLNVGPKLCYRLKHSFPPSLSPSLPPLPPNSPLPFHINLPPPPLLSAPATSAQALLPP